MDSNSPCRSPQSPAPTQNRSDSLASVVLSRASMPHPQIPHTNQDPAHSSTSPSPAPAAQYMARENSNNPPPPRETARHPETALHHSSAPPPSQKFPSHRCKSSTPAHTALPIPCAGHSAPPISLSPSHRSQP